jgi:phospholipid/cholesterol/gamma-HCH transport system substrate-binding protein
MSEAVPLEPRERMGDRPRAPLLFVGSGLLLTALLLVGLAREQGWGQRHLNLRLLIGNATGVRVGQDVRISGLPVGQVRAINLRPDARVEVQLQVVERYAALVGPRSEASQGQEGFVGDHYLALSPDPQPPGTALQRHRMQGRTLAYVQPTPIASMMQDLAKTQANLQSTLVNTSRLTGRDLPQTLGAMRQSLGEVNGLSEALRQETVATAPQLRQTLQSVQRETTATAPPLRQTLRQISATGSSAGATAVQAEQLLRESRPLVVSTLTELQRVSSTSRQLLQLLSRFLGSEATLGTPTLGTPTLEKPKGEKPNTEKPNGETAKP